jgi:hypothetical protein
MNREEWLNEAVKKVTPIFTQRGYEVPKVRVSCGFASTGKTRHIGQCWAKEISHDEVNEIFISPKLDDPVDVMDTLIHELVHAVDNCKNSHGKEFKKIALRVGLEGHMRSAHAGKPLREKLSVIAKELPEYPHKKLRIVDKIIVRRPTPKAVCKECGYQINVPKKYIEYGAPLCPLHETKMEEIGNWEEDL